MAGIDKLIDGENQGQDVPIAVVTWIAACVVVLTVWAFIGKPAVLLPPDRIDLTALHRAKVGGLGQTCPVPKGGFTVKAPSEWKVQWHKNGDTLRMVAPKPTIAAIVAGFDTVEVPLSANPRLMDLRLAALRTYYKPIRVESLRPVRLAGLAGIEYILDDGKINTGQIEIYEGRRRYVLNLAVPKGKLSGLHKHLYAVAASFKKKG